MLQAPGANVVCCCRSAPLQGSSNQYCCCGNAAECCQSDSFCSARNCLNIVILSMMAVLIAAGVLVLWYYRRVPLRLASEPDLRSLQPFTSTGNYMCLFVAVLEYGAQHA